MNRPNILYIHSHDTGRYIQPYGHAVATPTLQRLAEEGVLFRQAFCAAPTCSPSRAALLTGQAAHSAGMLGLAHPFAQGGFTLDDYGQHLLHTLRRAGYRSALAGIQHIVRQHQDPAEDARHIGYDLYLGSAAEAERVARDFLDAAPTQPFFLDVGFFETHRHGKVDGGAFNPAGSTGDARYTLPPVPLPDTPDTRRDMADYKVAAARLDDKIAVVLAALARNGLAENTLVVCTTDHGVAFPDMKCSLSDHGIGVMLIVRGPGGFTGGRVSDAMVSHIDVFPTLCDLLGLDHPAWLQGRSLMPLLQGEADEVNSAVFAEVTYHAAFEPKRAVRSRRFKYIRHYAEPPMPVAANCDASPSKELWLEHGWLGRPVAAEQLYDLVFDPTERRNLAGDPAHHEVLVEMRGKLEGWMRETGDPLLSGTVPLPPGSST